MDAGTIGIRELDGDGFAVLIANFDTGSMQEELLDRFARYSPQWKHEDAHDWIQHTQDAWPGRTLGEKLFLAPVWCEDRTPPGRVRIIHNPGLACGTGEHPCTQLALMALEQFVSKGCLVVDVGTGSGLLAIAALRLGAELAIGLDTDECALRVARENFLHNDLRPSVVAGSVDALMDSCADIAVANISGTVLFSILDKLLRITRKGGHLILSCFTDTELAPFTQDFPAAHISRMDEWRCVAAKLW